MNQQLFKNFYLDYLKQIKIKTCSYQTKIKLIQGLIQRLKFMDNNPQLLSIGLIQKNFIYNTPETKKSTISKQQSLSQNQSTSYSFYSDNSQILGQNSASDYEQKIMQKRVIKFEINEQIEALEDDLFEIQKVVETKRIFNDELAKNIQKRMKQIGQNSKVTKQDTLSFVSKTSSKITKRDQICEMNMTISGASGFGIVNKSKQSVNSSLSTTRKQIDLNKLNPDILAQRKKAKSHYLGKGITGIFKNILK